MRNMKVLTADEVAMYVEDGQDTGIQWVRWKRNS